MEELNYEEMADYITGFYPPGTPVDWDDALFRVEKAFDIDLPEGMLDPVIKKIQAETRKARKAWSE